MAQVVKEFFDRLTWTLSYIVYDSVTRDALVIDPVWDYEPAASRLSTESLAELMRFIQAEDLKVHLILETHAHADHVTGAQALKEKFPNAKVGIGAHITKVQEVFKDVFHLSSSFPTDGRQFDLLLKEEEECHAGSLVIQTLFTPGHTPACASYLIGDCVFVGDAIFMPDYGTGRCDFPAGSAKVLYESIHDKLYRLPPQTKVYTAHDYLPNGRELRFQSTIKEQRETNIQLREATTLEEFVRFRESRDKTLAAPRLLLPSVQINIDAGHLPKTESNGVSYLKIPLHQT